MAAASSFIWLATFFHCRRIHGLSTVNDGTSQRIVLYYSAALTNQPLSQENDVPTVLVAFIPLLLSYRGGNAKRLRLAKERRVHQDDETGAVAARMDRQHVCRRYLFAMSVAITKSIFDDDT